MNDSPEKSEFIELIKTALAASTNAKGVLAVPTLIIPIKATYWQKVSSWAKRSEETALAFFRSLDIHGDRTMMNLEGYPGLLRDLLYPPPWIEVEWDDVIGSLTEEHADELGSLFLQAKAYGVDELLKSLRDHIVENQALQ